MLKCEFPFIWNQFFECLLTDYTRYYRSRNAKIQTLPSNYYCTGWTEKRTWAPTRRSAKVSGTTKETPLFHQKMLFFLLRLEDWKDVLQAEEATWITDTATEWRSLECLGKYRGLDHTGQNRLYEEYKFHVSRKRRQLKNCEQLRNIANLIVQLISSMAVSRGRLNGDKSEWGVILIAQ